MRIPTRSLLATVGLVSSLWLGGCDGSTAPDTSSLKVTAAMRLIFTGAQALSVVPNPEGPPFNLVLDVTIQNIGVGTAVINDNACTMKLELFADATHDGEPLWTSPTVMCLLLARQQRLAMGQQVVWTSSYSTVPAGTYFGIVTTGVGADMMSIDAGSITMP